MTEVKELDKNTKPRLTPPIPWYGGKSIIIEDILRLMPEHNKYIEPFGGAGHVLFAKPESDVEIYNDIHSGVVNFYRVLRDDDKREELVKMIECTPYSREEMELSHNWTEVDDEIEKARMFYVLAKQSFSGIGTQRKAGWSYSINSNEAKSFFEGFSDFKDVHERLANVQIENIDAIKLLKNNNQEDVFAYIDPPYVLKYRSKKDHVYKYELKDKQHQDLLKVIENFEGMVLLSGYDNPMYKHRLEKLNDWERVEINVKACGSGKRNSEDGEYSKGERTEVIWMNPKCVEAPNMIKAPQKTLDRFME